MKIGFIGGGNMAGAITGGVIASGLCSKDEICVCDKNEAVLAKYDREIKTSTNNRDAFFGDYIILAVKPFILPKVLEEIAGMDKKEVEGKVFVSIAAGVTIDTIKQTLGSRTKVVRVMPNTPALFLEGMTVVAQCDNNVDQAEFSAVLDIFNSVGTTEVMPETMINTVTGVSGSSPAYVYMFIEAMADAGVRDGLARDAAYRLAAQSVLGSAKMVLESGKHPGELKDMVCSPKGTTIEAVAELEKRGFRSAVMEAIKACNDKANNIG